jgi:iterative type I PKS product template protein
MAPQIRVLRQHKLSTTSCQQVVYESLQPLEGTGTVIVQSDLTHPKLWPVTTGHVMNQRILVPSSLFADMAMTIADYLYKSLQPGAPTVGINVCNVEVHKPLMAELLPPADGQHIQLEAYADINTGEMKLTIRSVQWDGTFLQDHAHGLIHYEDPTIWEDEWRRARHLVQSQIDALDDKLSTGGAHKFLRGMAYKLFGVMNYGPKYQGMSEVILDKTDTEAVARIQFQSTPGADGDFFCSPYYIDNLCHLSGFIVMSYDVESDEPLRYISHGWESLKFLRPSEFSHEKIYTSYVRMIPQGKNVLAGDVYIMDGGEIIAVLYGLKFQGIPQKLMNVLVPPARKTAFAGVKSDGTSIQKRKNGKSKVSFTA